MYVCMYVCMYVHRGNAVTALARDGGVVVVDIECVPLNGAQLAEDVVSHLSSAPGAILVACKLVLQQQHAGGGMARQPRRLVELADREGLLMPIRLRSNAHDTLRQCRPRSAHAVRLILECVQR
jgi:hypothetical protein